MPKAETKKVHPAQRQSRPGLESEMNPKPVSKDTKKPSGKLLNKIAVITGGDSGIGKAVALLFAKEGADIAIIYLNEHTDAEEVKNTIEETHDRNCLTIAGDLSKEDFCKKAIEKVIDEYGRIDILVNNAAIHYESKSLEDITTQHLIQTFETNVYSMFWLTKFALPYIKKGGSIINSASVVAYRGSSHLIDYAATKGAVVAFTRSLASNLVDKGIRVNGVAPGPIWTPLIASSFEPEKVAEHGSADFLDRAIKLAPDNGYFYYKRAELKMDNNDMEGAMADYSRSIEMEKDPEAFNGRGLIKFQLVDYNGAIKDYDSAIEKDSLFSEAYLNRGIAKVESGMIEEAIADFTSAISTKNFQDSSQRGILTGIAYFERGKCYSKQGKYQEALNDFNKSLELDPSNSSIYYERAVVKAGLGDFEGSIEDYSASVDKERMVAESYNNRGLVKLYLVDFEGSIADFTNAIQADSTFSDALVNRANVKTEIGDIEGALKDYNKAIEQGFVKKSNKKGEKQPDKHKQSHALLKRAYAKYKSGNYKEAIKDYDQAISVNDTNSQAYYFRANAKHDLNDISGAIVDYNKAINLTPQNPKVYFNRGTLYYEQKNYEQALADYNKAIELNPKFMQAYHNRGAIKEETQQFDKAIADYDAAIQIEEETEDSMLKESLMHRGLCKIKSGDKTGCRDLNKAVELKATNAYSLVKKFCK